MALKLINPGGLPPPLTYSYVVGVQTLARTGYLIEVDAVAVIDD